MVSHSFQNSNHTPLSSRFIDSFFVFQSSSFVTFSLASLSYFPSFVESYVLNSFPSILVPAPIFNETEWNWKNTRFFASIWVTSRLLYSSARVISLCLQSLILSSFDLYYSCPWLYRKLRLILIIFSYFGSVTETLRSPPCVIATIRSMHYP